MLPLDLNTNNKYAIVFTWQGIHTPANFSEYYIMGSSATIEKYNLGETKRLNGNIGTTNFTPLLSNMPLPIEIKYFAPPKLYCFSLMEGELIKGLTIQEAYSANWPKLVAYNAIDMAVAEFPGSLTSSTFMHGILGNNCNDIPLVIAYRNFQIDNDGKIACNLPHPKNTESTLLAEIQKNFTQAITTTTTTKHRGGIAYWGFDSKYDPRLLMHTDDEEDRAIEENVLFGFLQENMRDWVLPGEAALPLCNALPSRPYRLGHFNEATALKAAIRLYQNVPNPFGTSTEITYELAEEGFISLSLYNMQGQLIQNLAEGNTTRGKHSLHITADELDNGLYFCRLSIPGHAGFTIKLSCIK